MNRIIQLSSHFQPCRTSAGSLSAANQHLYIQWVDKSLSDSDFPVIPPSNLIYCMTHNFTASRDITILSSAIDFLGKIGLM
jgi:hypothetical protein